MLKKTNIELELFTDVDDYTWIQKNLKGGVSCSMKRFAKANNKHMKNYDPSLPSSHIVYLDANNLYGWAMSQYLPLNNFKNVDDISPATLHDEHNLYPLAPEHKKIKQDGLSKYCQQLLSEKGFNFSPTEKLIPIEFYRSLNLLG